VYSRRKLVAMLSVALIVTVGCRGCAVIDTVQARLRGAPRPIATPVLPAGAALPETAPTAAPTAIAAERIGSLAELPEEAGTMFEVQVTEDELNERLGGETVERQGITLSAPQVTLADGELLGAVTASQAASGASVQVRFRGRPRVEDGQVLLAIEDVTLDDAVRGVTRLVLQGLIDQALEQTGAADGIALPLDGLESIEIVAVRVEPGVVIVTGRTR